MTTNMNTGKNPRTWGRKERATKEANSNVLYKTKQRERAW